MRRLTVGLLGLSAALMLSLEGCSSDRSPVSARRVTAQTKDEPEKKKNEDGGRFELPDDKGGQLLSKVLPPRTKQGSLNRVDRPAPPTVPAPKFVEPAATLPQGTALVMRAPTPASKSLLRPRVVTDEAFEGSVDEPVLPRPPSFVPERLTSVPSEDVSIPPLPPFFAVPTIDRVAADDFTMEASTEAVLTAPLPLRTKPAPFVKGGVPEPFENRKPLTTPPPSDEAEPVVDGPAVPK